MSTDQGQQVYDDGERKDNVVTHNVVTDNVVGGYSGMARAKERAEAEERYAETEDAGVEHDMAVELQYDAQQLATALELKCREIARYYSDDLRSSSYLMELAARANGMYFSLNRFWSLTIE